jgi:hypothetical protein
MQLRHGPFFAGPASDVYSEVRLMIWRDLQKNLPAALRMRDGFFDGREGVGCHHRYVHSAGRDHLGCLLYRWRTFGRRLGMAQPKAPYRKRLEDKLPAG